MSRQVMTPQQVAAIKTIAIVSSVGDEMMTIDVPFFGLGSSVTKGPIADLDLDTHVIAQLTDRLKDHYQIVPVNYKSTDFRSDRMKAPIGTVVHDATTLPSGTPTVDAYIVLTTTTIEIRNSGRHVRGAFMARLATVSGHEHYAGVIFKMTVVDGHSFQPISNIDVVDYDAVNQDYWADGVSALTASQRDKLKQELNSQLDATLRPALKRLPLID
ncbi:MAG TPA: hypothetical protein VM639_13715 [Dongiaceae bacterium]|nr:hypothetical protein [Dongiaceae bacterium]